MIEMIYRGDSKNKGARERRGLPKNIRQIGDAGKDKRVYIEDYAATFLESTEYAVLLGEIWTNGGMKCLFVDSAVKVEPHLFGEAMWDKVYADAKQYFPDREILGWARKVENEEDCEEEVLNLHREQFPGEDRLMVLHDGEGETSVWLTESTGVRRQQGYYLYYEKNEQMQNYMVKENGGKSVEAENSAGDSAITNFRRRIAEKRQNTVRKEEDHYAGRSPLMMRFLYGASMFLVLTIFVIGVTMISNYNRMKEMEMTLSEMVENEDRPVYTDEVTLAVNSQMDESEASEKAPGDREAGAQADRLDESGDTTVGQEDGISNTSPETQGGAQESEMGLNKAAREEENAQDQEPDQTGENTQTGETGQAEGNNQPGETNRTEETGQAEGSQSKSQGQPESDAQNRAAEATSPDVRRMQAEYTVKAGDTLATVCRMYYGDLEKLNEICILNNIENPDRILPGQKIVLP